MNKLILSICLLVVISSSANAISSKLEESSHLRKLSYTRAINLNYNNNSNQYYVGVNLPSPGNTQLPTYKNNMMVSICSTDNIITGTTSNSFQAYLTSGYGTTPIRPSSPYFTGTAYGANIPITVPCSDGSNLNIGASTFNSATYGTNNNALYLTSMSTKQIQNLGQNSYGYLGLSVSNLAANGAGSLFSVYLDRYTRNGLLILDKDSSYSKNILSSASWNTNGSWVTTGNLSVGVGSTIVAGTAANLKFDINANITGLPSAIFSQVITALSAYGVTGCTTDPVLPSCKYTGKLRNLPSITVGNVGGSQTIVLPPSIYVAGTSHFGGMTTGITLNFMSLSNTAPAAGAFSLTSPFSSDDNPSWVTVQDANTIILDSSVLTYYYSVFQANSDGTGTVTLYVASGSAYPNFYYNWPLWGKIMTWVVVGFLGLFALLACCHCIRRRRLMAQAEAK